MSAAIHMQSQKNENLHAEQYRRLIAHISVIAARQFQGSIKGY
jgi:hypothetical protein